MHGLQILLLIVVYNIFYIYIRYIYSINAGFNQKDGDWTA